MKNKQLQVGDLVTITKLKHKFDGLNKFAGWDCKVLALSEDGEWATVTHPFDMGEGTDEKIEVPVDRLVHAGKDVGSPTPAKKAKSATAQIVDNGALPKGWRIRTKTATKVNTNWMTLAKDAKMGSTTVVALNAAGKEVRVWRKDIVEIQPA